MPVHERNLRGRTNPREGGHKETRLRCMGMLYLSVPRMRSLKMLTKRTLTNRSKARTTPHLEHSNSQCHRSVHHDPFLITSWGTTRCSHQGMKRD